MHKLYRSSQLYMLQVNSHEVGKAESLRIKPSHAGSRTRDGQAEGILEASFELRDIDLHRQFRVFRFPKPIQALTEVASKALGAQFQVVDFMILLEGTQGFQRHGQTKFEIGTRLWGFAENLYCCTGRGFTASEPAMPFSSNMFMLDRRGMRQTRKSKILHKGSASKSKMLQDCQAALAAV